MMIDGSCAKYGCTPTDRRKSAIFSQTLEVSAASITKIAVADLGFPRGGGANSPGGANIQFRQNFPKTA